MYIYTHVITCSNTRCVVMCHGQQMRFSLAMAMVIPQGNDPIGLPLGRCREVYTLFGKQGRY